MTQEGASRGICQSQLSVFLQWIELIYRMRLDMYRLHRIRYDMHAMSSSHVRLGRVLREPLSVEYGPIKRYLSGMFAGLLDLLIAFCRFVHVLSG